MKRFLFLLGITFTFLPLANVYAQSELSKEELLEETLMVRYLPNILEVTDKLFMCERITNIKRLDGNRQHELTIEVMTFEKAHMPPYDLYRITLTDKPDEITVTKIERAENISPEQLKKSCSK
ncbi:DUF3888 domain-containing protein [Bacillus sp. ISL-47]|uniref:DUF3888 domain-containing protein n=1 Tax=Bacillus sp. ISL-47 TaxID=2819130 RepID=UPI001BE8CAF3|nr:DUF3888 domain-containing protein [Bacillus sp. ISL-47]MBT2686861.1 DUF3888 domain-containing protein [Bacillus sp. ISL-47]MBT2706784.1 DUF3888 domain-containing protein [Pseudomonas sp. ISL-84]